MTAEESARSQELRTQLAAVLRANRELGPGYEQVAVDQLVDIVAGNRPAAPAPRVQTVPRGSAGPGCGGRWRGAPWWMWGGAIWALLAWGPGLLRGAGLGSLTWIPMVLVLVVFAQVVRGISRWGRRLGDGSGDDPLVRSRRWS